MPVKWTWPRGTAAQYCIKVSLATLTGYLLSFGGPLYALYGAFSAALVVGASRGEDTNSAANRVRGSVAGMLVGIAVTLAPLPPALAVTLGIGVAAYLCMGFGWGVAATRIGASLCAVTVLMHGQDAVVYNTRRIANTLIGIAAGLLVSYVVLPVRGRDAMARASKRALVAISDLLAVLSRLEGSPPNAQMVSVIESMLDVQKALNDARKEVGGEVEALRRTAREIAMASIGALAAAVAHAELRQGPGGLAGASELCERAATLANRAGADVAAAAIRGEGPARSAPVASPDGIATGSVDAMARHGFALALRQIDQALEALER